jgi:hypothetical protein
MGVSKLSCPDCGGQLHVESFVGHTGNTNAYVDYSCIGEKDLPTGSDGVAYTSGGSMSGGGCGFKAERRWDSETKEEKKKRVRSETLDSWEEWVEYREEKSEE